MSTVSVVIPTFNRAELVRRAIASALAEEPSEIIVVDDGSTDATPDAARAFGDAVIYLRRPHSGLPAAARNIGAASATGELLAFLDSDDEWLPGKLERQIRELDANPSLGLVCGNAAIAGREEPYGGGRPRRGRVLGELLRENFVITSTVVMRRSLFEELGGFSEDPRLRALEDYDLWLRGAAVTDVAYLPDVLAVYRDHPLATRRTIPPSSYWKAMLSILRRAEGSAGANEISNDLVETLELRYRRILHGAVRDERRYPDLVLNYVLLRWLSGRQAARLRLARARRAVRRLPKPDIPEGQ